MATITISNGGAEYVGGTITESTGKDISSATFIMGLSTSSTTPPTTTFTPDVSTVGTTTAQRILKLLVSSTLPVAAVPTVGQTYYVQCRITDTPEAIWRVLQSVTIA